MESEEAPNDAQLATLNTTLEKLQRKSLVLQDLDSKIADAIQTPEELETEVFEAEEIQDDILEMVDEVKRFLSWQATASSPQQTTRQTEPPTESTTVSSNLSAFSQPFQPFQPQTMGQVGLPQVPHPPHSQLTDSYLEPSSSSHGGLNAS